MGRPSKLSSASCVDSAGAGLDAGAKLAELTAKVDALSGLLDSHKQAGEQSTETQDASDIAVNDVANRIRHRLQADTNSGAISVDRANVLGSMFERFMGTATAGGKDRKSMRVEGQKMREAIEQMADIAMDPSWKTPNPPLESAAASVEMLLRPPKRFLIAEQSQPMAPTQVAHTGSELLRRVFELEHRSREHQADKSVMAEIEGQSWRIAVEVQEYVRRDHVTLARPYFSTARRRAPPRSLFLSGGDRLLTAARLLGNLEVLHEARVGRLSDGNCGFGEEGKYQRLRISGAAGHRWQIGATAAWTRAAGSECSPARPYDIDRERQTVRVRKGKGGPSRIVALRHPDCLVPLQAWLATRGEFRGAPLFCTLKGTAIETSYVRHLMPRLARRAGIDRRLHSHAFRHTLAAELAHAGVPLEHIQQQLGHRKLKTTFEYLAGISLDPMAVAAIAQPAATHNPRPGPRTTQRPAGRTHHVY